MNGDGGLGGPLDGDVGPLDGDVGEPPGGDVAEVGPPVEIPLETPPLGAGVASLSLGEITVVGDVGTNPVSLPVSVPMGLESPLEKNGGLSRLGVVSSVTFPLPLGVPTGTNG